MPAAASLKGTPLATLQDPLANKVDAFGVSVAISGDTVVIGANGTDGSRGTAYVYRKTAAGWPATPTRTLTDPASDPPGDNFGKSVAISGSTIVVGAPNGYSTAPHTIGDAYVYTMGTPGWFTTPAATLNEPGSTSFGYWTAVSGGTMVIGANPGNGTGIGNAYIYTEGTSGWPTSPTATLNDPQPTTSNGFGMSVSVAGSDVFVGAPWSFGRDYAYAMGTAGWPETPTAVLHHPAGTPGFGYSTDTDGTFVMVGEPNGGSAPGAVFIYRA
ncbi:MAG TPA: FG-GAP repeat protein [Streptosporangiaceae bacterium]|jgi:hypothetical protein